MTRNLMDESHRMSLIISSIIIIGVQLVSILLISFFMLADLRRNADYSTNEISAVLMEPMYNMDDSQTIRIGESALVSGRVARIAISSATSGKIFDRRIEPPSKIIKPQIRKIVYRNIELGTIELEFSDKMLQSMVTGFIYAMLLVVVAVTAANFLANRFFVQKRIKRELEYLMNGISEIGAGKYGKKLESRGYTDIDAIIGIMNDMSEKVDTKNRELTSANTRLEARVKERTAKLETALAEQHLLQDQLIESGKLTALGQLSAGIAHELNTPLGAIISSARTLSEYLDEKIIKLPDFVAELTREERHLYDTLLELGIRENRTLSLTMRGRKDIKALAQKFSDANITSADEIAERLNELGLYAEADSIMPRMGTAKDLEIIIMAMDSAIARRMAEVVTESSRKAANVVNTLKSYLSPEMKQENTLVDIDRDLKYVLTLMHNMLKHDIEVQTEFGGAKTIGSSDKLSQVWMNIIRNAAQAINFAGTIKIRTGEWNGCVYVEIEDSGPGIPEDIQRKIFEPFFTTKKQGEGMGLGLDLCKKIIEASHGTISFESKPGKTVFTVTMPAADAAAKKGEPQ